MTSYQKAENYARDAVLLILSVGAIIRCNETKLHRYGNFYDILKQQGITLEEFDALKLRDVATLNKHERRVLKAVRESIANPTEDTLLRKTIPISAVDDYLKEGGDDRIRGYVARDCDVAHIKSYSYLRESLCLNYDIDGWEPFPADGNAYGYIKFRTGDTGNLKITYGKEFGGTTQDGYPCTRNGFLGSENGEIIPEWKLKNIYEDGEKVKAMDPKPGAEIHEVRDGKDYLVGIYKDQHFEKVTRTSVN